MTTLDHVGGSSAVVDAISTACDRIAPTWPLDQSTAVNPYWGWRQENIAQAAAALGSLSGTRLTMPLSWFSAERAAGRLSDGHIAAAAALAGDPALAAQAMACVTGTCPDDGSGVARAALITDVRDFGQGPRPGQTWTDLVTHQISQHCAAHFDDWQGSWHPAGGLDLFAAWRGQRTVSHGAAWCHGATWVQDQIALLPTEPADAIAMMLASLAIDEGGRVAYLTSLLLSVNGWASWCAFRRWQARLDGDDDDEIVAILAVRLAWEWLLYSDAQALGNSSQLAGWATSWPEFPTRVAAAVEQQRVEWLLQSAAEQSYQATIIEGLGAALGPAHDVPAIQAVFCLDVRSERLRRALETDNADVQTRGFAGFFGLPLSYTPGGTSYSRPQLPGLLAPTLDVTETTDLATQDPDALAAERAATLGPRQRWTRFRSAPSSMFTFVETLGILYGAKLVADSLPTTRPPAPWEHDGLSAATVEHLHPQLRLIADPAAAAALVHKVLCAMGLTADFAPIVMLCGHASRSTNNPQAAGLDCGACGGQSGEVNARVLVDLLNSGEVRDHLVPLGVTVPATTRFLAALHNTATDEVQLFDLAGLSAEMKAAVEQLEHRLSTASDRVRAERAESLGLGHLEHEPQQLRAALLERANDWSQVRPEWGLAGNAAFIVAPRQRTRHMNLDGRVFMQDYDCGLDPDMAVLTGIMTAPMIVTNWINMHYNASTVDNLRYGSGNKVLHNVVDGRIGVFEGNGGDLRIGLAEQSLHDGQTLRHSPLRLSVFIEAPQNHIDSVIAAHDVVHDLIVNGWIHLLRIDPAGGHVERWVDGVWCAP